MQTPHIIPLKANWSSSRSGAPIVAIVAHGTVGRNSVDYLRRGGDSPDGSDRKVSIHALIGKAGQIWTYIDDSRAAHHAGFSTLRLSGQTYCSGCRYNVNHVTLGFELENLQDGRDPYTDAQLLSMGWLINKWRKQHGNVPVVRHGDIDPTRRRDPVGLSVAQIEAWVTKAAGHTPPDPPAPQPETWVIGVNSSITQSQWLAFLKRHDAPESITQIVGLRIYNLANQLDIDIALCGAMWIVEQGTPLGGNGLGLITPNPLNIKSYGDRWPSVEYKDEKWNAYESWQLGWMHTIMHLKQLYGAEGLLTVEQIIPKFAPRSDGNDVDNYINKVKQYMSDMQSS